MKQSKKIILIRYGWVLLGLAINSFGIALMTKSALGTSQISSIPYVLSLRFEHLSFGMTTFLINMIFVAGEIVLLKKDFHPVQFLQIPLTLIVTMILAPFFLKAIQKAGIHRKLFPEHTEGHSAA